MSKIGGKEFNSFNILCVKLVGDCIYHKGLRYKLDENFNESEIIKNKSHFIDLKKIFFAEEKYNKIVFLEIPDDAEIIVHENNFITNMYIIKKIIKLDDLYFDYVYEEKELYKVLDYLSKNNVNLLGMDKFIKHKLNETIKIFCSNNGYNIRFVKNPSDELCILAFENNSECIKYMKNLSEEMCLYIVNNKKYHKYFNYIEKYFNININDKEKYLNINDKEKYAKIMCLNRGLSLEYVKEQTEEICEIAINSDPESFEFVKDKTLSLCKLACGKSGYCLKYVPSDLKTEEICMLACSNWGYALENVENQTEELCLFAIKHFPYSLECVKNQTEKMCKISCSKKGKCLKYVKNQTEEICMIACENDLEAFEYVENKSFEICKYACGKNPSYLKNIKKPSLELIKSCYDKFFNMFGESLLSEINHTYNIYYYTCEINDNIYEIYKFLCEKNGLFIKDIKSKTQELCEIAVNENPLAIQYIPKHFMSKEMIEKVLEKNSSCVSFIPEELLTDNLYKNVLNKNGLYLKFIPKIRQTEELCKIAYENNNDACDYILNDTILLRKKITNTFF
jgi:hypothetical protein